MAQLVAAVATKVEKTGSLTLDSDTSEQIEQLHRQVSSAYPSTLIVIDSSSMILKVDAIVKAMKSRNLFKRVIGFRDDAVKLQEYREDLKVAIAVFGVGVCYVTGSVLGMLIILRVGTCDDNERGEHAKSIIVAKYVTRGPAEYS